MTTEQFDREKRYQIAMHIARTMLSQDLITDQEYLQINTIFIEKYQPFFGCLYRDIP